MDAFTREPTPRQPSSAAPTSTASRWTLCSPSGRTIAPATLCGNGNRPATRSSVTTRKTRHTTTRSSPRRRFLADAEQAPWCRLLGRRLGLDAVGKRLTLAAHAYGPVEFVRRGRRVHPRLGVRTMWIIELYWAGFHVGYVGEGWQAIDVNGVAALPFPAGKRPKAWPRSSASWSRESSGRFWATRTQTEPSDRRSCTVAAAGGRAASAAARLTKRWSLNTQTEGKKPSVNAAIGD